MNFLRDTRLTRFALQFSRNGSKYTVDPTKKPKAIDYTMTEGTTKGKTHLGIYEVNGDMVKFCFAAPDQDRPTEFTAKEGSGWTLSVWKRDIK